MVSMQLCFSAGLAGGYDKTWCVLAADADIAEGKTFIFGGHLPKQLKLKENGPPCGQICKLGDAHGNVFSVG